MIKINRRNPQKKISEETQEKVEAEQNDKQDFVLDVPGMRLVTLYGDLEEKKAVEIITEFHGYVDMKRTLEEQVKQVPAKARKQVEKNLAYAEPVKFLISTFGGSAVDMFGIYDTMSMVKEHMEIHTVGSGKVMSAGVLLLASGTKGKRMIGRNCRVMVHSVIGGAHGPMHDIQNEVEEILQTQTQYIECLANETKLTVSRLNKLFSEKRNIYLSAEEAVKFGIADKIL